MTRILAALALLTCCCPSPPPARAGDPDERFGRQGTVTLKATAADAVGGAVKVISGNRVLAGGAAAGQFVVVRLRSTGTLDSQASAPAARSSPRCPARRSTASARSRSSATDGSSPRARCARRTGRRGSSPSGCCRPARSTRASARASATCWPGPAGSELSAMMMDTNGNVITRRLARGQRPDRDPAAGGRQPGPDVRRRRDVRRRARRTSAAGHRTARAPRRDADLHRRRRSRRRVSGDVHGRPGPRPTGVPDPAGTAPGS